MLKSIDLLPVVDPVPVVEPKLETKKPRPRKTKKQKNS